jgi:hypothetical protein
MSDAIRPDLISVNEEIALLRMEYERMTGEIRMYVKEYSPKLSVFGIFVLGAVTFAWSNVKYDMVFLIVPYFLFLIAGVTISQAYIITCLAERVRQIERRVKELNGDKWLLRWESLMATKLIYPPLINVKTKNGKRFRAINPIFAAVILMIIAVVPIVVFCIFRIWKSNLFTSSFFWLYSTITSFLFLIVVFGAISWFRLDRITSNIDFIKSNY